MTISSNTLIRTLEMFSYRQTNVLIFAVCTGLFLTALYMQFAMGMHPCPLCITQRIFIVAIGLFALAAAIQHPARLGRRIYAGLMVVAALMGGGVSLRHVWIQNLPEHLVPACGPGLSYMFDVFPLLDALRLLFQGDGNCADISWQLLGFSMPAWVAFCYFGLLLAALWQGLRAVKP